jgi:hypothetical protein
MGINLISPSAIPSATLIYDTGTVTGGPIDSVALMTKVNGVPVNAALEIQSVSGTLLLPRMTTTQKNALTTVVDGMLLFDNTLGVIQGREGSSWVTLSNNSGGTFTAGVGSAAAPTYTFVGRTNTGMYSSAANTIDFSTGGTRQFNITNTPSAVNFIEVTGGSTGNDPILSTSGSDTNVGLDLVFKGNGVLNLRPDNVNGTIVFWNSSDTFYTALSSLNPTSNITYTLPDTLPTTGQTPVTCDVFGHLSADSIGPIIYAQIPALTHLEIQGLSSAPPVLLSAPGAGKIIIVHRTNFKLKKGGTTLYTNTGSASTLLRLQYGTNLVTGSTQASVDVSPNLFLSSTTSSMTSTSGIMIETTDVADGNKPISVAIDGSDLTGGDAGDTLVIDIWYSIVNLNS